MDASDIIQYIVVPCIALLVGAIVVTIIWIRYKRRQKRQDLEQQRFQQSLATPWIVDAQQPSYQMMTTMQHQAAQKQENFLHQQQQAPTGFQSYHGTVQYPDPVAAQGAPPGYYYPPPMGHGQQQQ
ncbi:hypothetical protein BJX64DRAFT_49687 [Aspergillus heterothallicus]